jgi:dihydrodipicolinate synthase/N-acetylneuraminate lyase
MNNPLQPKAGFKGVWPDALTPVKADYSLDLHRLESHIRTLLYKGASGVVLFGECGEGPSFSHEEKTQALAHLIKEGIPSSAIMLACVNSSAPEVAKLIHLADYLKLRAVLISTPFYYQDLSTDGLVNYFDFLFEHTQKSPTHCYLHLLPNKVHHELPEAVLNTVLEKHHERIFGIINQTGSSSLNQDLLKSFAEKVLIYACLETDVRALKCSGIISAMANIIPKVVQQQLHGSEEVQAIQIPGLKVKSSDERLVEFQSVLAQHPSIAAYKYLLSQVYKNHDWKLARPPLSALDSSSVTALDKTFAAFGLHANFE